jgi:hypothetical protein
VEGSWAPEPPTTGGGLVAVSVVMVSAIWGLLGRHSLSSVLLSTIVTRAEGASGLVCDEIDAKLHFEGFGGGWEETFQQGSFCCECGYP